MKVDEYTLLIVESSTLADRIKSNQIPWLEVIPTDGFLWSPVFNPKKEVLTAKADPGKREIRNEIRDKSGWAAKIIIATDNDPAGDFIAWTLLNFLKDKNTYRTSIHHPGPDSVKKQISRAKSVVAGHLKQQLEIRYLFKVYWKKAFPDLSAEVVALSRLYHDFYSLNDYKDNAGNHFISRNFNSDAGQTISGLNVKKTDDHFYLFSPPSTFDILQKLAIHRFNSFSEISEQLFRLFTHRVESKHVHLINYPRTPSRSYYHNTWNEIERHAYRSKSGEKLKPESEWEVTDENFAHESLRPVDLSESPESIRALLPRNLHNLYEIIYNSFMQSISIHKVTTYINEHNQFYLIQPGDKPIGESTILNRCATVGSTGHLMYELGISRPSKFGKQLDSWIQLGYITHHTGFLNRGPALPLFSARFGKAFELLQKSRSVIEAGNAEYLKELFRVS